MNIAVMREDSRTRSSSESGRVGKNIVPGQVNADGWKSGPKGRKRRRKQTDERRVSRQGWKRHPKTREKMETGVPAVGTQSPPKQKVPRPRNSTPCRGRPAGGRDACSPSAHYPEPLCWERRACPSLEEPPVPSLGHTHTQAQFSCQRESHDPNWPITEVHGLGIQDPRESWDLAETSTTGSGSDAAGSPLVTPQSAPA